MKNLPGEIETLTKMIARQPYASDLLYRKAIMFSRQADDDLAEPLGGFRPARLPQTAPESRGPLAAATQPHDRQAAPGRPGEQAGEAAQTAREVLGLAMAYRTEYPGGLPGVEGDDKVANSGRSDVAAGG